MSKTLHFPDINVTLATLAINVTLPPTTHALVLGEIIRLSQDGVITKHKALSPIICERLQISDSLYRASITKLTKLRLIYRDGSVLILAPIVKTPFSHVTMLQK